MYFFLKIHTFECLFCKSTLWIKLNSLWKCLPAHFLTSHFPWMHGNTKQGCLHFFYSVWELCSRLVHMSVVFGYSCHLRSVGCTRFCHDLPFMLSNSLSFPWWPAYLNFIVARLQILVVSSICQIHYSHSIALLHHICSH